jgi:hypothetical protein
MVESIARMRMSRSTEEDRETVYQRIKALPNQTLEADSPADARAQLNLEGEMSMGTFKSALAHLVHPIQSQGEYQRVSHTRSRHLSRTKSSRPPHIWRAVADESD